MDLLLRAWRILADWCLADYSSRSVVDGMWLTEGDPWCIGMTAHLGAGLWTHNGLSRCSPR